MDVDAAELTVTGQESDCSYLPGRVSQFDYRLALALSTERYERLLERGWRRFGRTLFRPRCPACGECRSLRVNLSRFAASKSQRRVQRRCANVTLVVQRPTLSVEHIDLYNEWHRDMAERRGWPYREIDEDQYFESFLDGDFEFSREFQYRRDGQLIGLGLVDVTGNVMSSIYFVHDPTIRDDAPGTMSVLREIDYGRQTGHQWLYLGYYIRDCGSMNYKNRFAPHEFLDDYVPDEVTPIWSEPAE